MSCSPDEAFEIFTHQIGEWWPLPSHSVFESESATVAFEQGQILERSTDGRTCLWGEVISWDPPDSLSFTWHPGRPAEERTEVTVTFRAEAGATRVELRPPRLGPARCRRGGAASRLRQRRRVDPGARGPAPPPQGLSSGRTPYEHHVLVPVGGGGEPLMLGEAEGLHRSQGSCVESGHGQPERGRSKA